MEAADGTMHRVELSFGVDGDGLYLIGGCTCPLDQHCPQVDKVGSALQTYLENEGLFALEDSAVGPDGGLKRPALDPQSWMEALARHHATAPAPEARQQNRPSSTFAYDRRPPEGSPAQGPYSLLVLTMGKVDRRRTKNPAPKPLVPPSTYPAWQQAMASTEDETIFRLLDVLDPPERFYDRAGDARAKGAERAVQAFCCGRWCRRWSSRAGAPGPAVRVPCAMAPCGWERSSGHPRRRARAG